MPIDLGRIAEEFPGAKDQIYLNCAARGLTPKCARSAVDALLDAGTFGSGDKDEMFETVERVRDGFAQMINAQTDEIAITKNVSVVLLPLGRNGKSVRVFPSDVVPVINVKGQTQHAWDVGKLIQNTVSL